MRCQLLAVDALRMTVSLTFWGTHMEVHLWRRAREEDLNYLNTMRSLREMLDRRFRQNVSLGPLTLRRPINR